MEFRTLSKLLFLILLVPGLSQAQSGRSLLARAERDIEHMRYAEAESTLTALVSTSRDDLLQESMFLLAGLKTSADEAQRLYLRVVDEDPGSEWSRRAQLELAKVQYALGNYGEAKRILDDADACGVTEEACLFQGLSALMLKRYNEARGPLGRIRKGKLRTWAYLALAEVETGLNRPEEACQRYEALSNAMINPTALYRYGECLENVGDVKAAKEQFNEIVANFQDTPEAVLAGEKLQRLTASKPPPEPESHVAGEPVLKQGFTIQFGSFRDRGNAIKLAAKIKRLYPGVRVDSELINYREHHRVRYGYFRTREEAQAKGEEISRELNEDFTIMTLP